MVIKSIILLAPPPKRPRTVEDAPCTYCSALGRSPKSCVLPVDAIVTYSIILDPALSYFLMEIQTQIHHESRLKDRLDPTYHYLNHQNLLHFQLMK